MNEPKVVYRIILTLFSLPTCLGVSNLIVKHFTFQPHAPPKKNRGGRTSVLLTQGTENLSYATGYNLRFGTVRGYLRTANEY